MSTGKSNVRTGKAFERRVANLLTEWTNKTFRRRRIEGRQEEVHALEGGGDVICIDSTFRFNVECKKGKDFSLDALLATPDTCKFTSWWEQTCIDANMVSEAKSLEIHPMLFFKPHPNFDWVAVPDISLLSTNLLIPLPSLKFNYELSLIKNKQIVPNIIMVRWKDFKKSIKPEYLFFDDRM